MWKCSNLGYHPSMLLEGLIPSTIYEPYTLQTESRIVTQPTVMMHNLIRNVTSSDLLWRP
jgi:hypothetical protein